MIAAERERFVIATKYALSTQQVGLNSAGNNRKNMMQSIDASLKRLKTDFVDLYWVHAWDYTTPIEEVMRGLDDLVRSGKVLYIGISDTPAWIISRANTLAELRGWTSFVGLQVEYNLTQRTVERELLPMAQSLDIGVTTWGPLAAGLLSGKYSKSNADPKRLGSDNQISLQNQAIIAATQKIADEIGKSPAQIALAWVRQKGTIPILGARKTDQLKANLESLNLTLSSDQIERLDQVSAIELGFPHDFIQSDVMRARLTAGTDSLLEQPVRH